MDCSAPVCAWTFEDDDEWLKNAFEAGTSFESLDEDEGALHFSPRFSFQEPRDPWDSLTYNANSSVEPPSQYMECVDSMLHVVECEGEKSGQKRKVKDDVPISYIPMLKRVRSGVVEKRDNTQSTDNMYGQEVQHHFASPVSHCESLDKKSNFPYFETDSDAAAFMSFTDSWEFEEVGPFCFDAETLVKFDETNLTCTDIDGGDSFTIFQIPTHDTYKSISELTFPESQVEEKESAANSANIRSPGDAKNYEFLGCDVHSDAMDQIPCHDMENLGPSTDGNLAGSSASFTTLRELEEFLFADIDGDDTANIPNLDSFLLDYGKLTSIPAENLEFPSAPASNNPEHHFACPPDAHLSATAANSVDPELYNGVILCVLNTEDDFNTPSSRRHPADSAWKPYQLRGIKAYYLTNKEKEKPDSSETV